MHRFAIVLALAVTLAALTGAPGAAEAQGRVALVIGNSAYRHAAPLPNPRNDAADVAAELRKLNFKVIDGADLDKAAFDRKVAEFAGALRGASVGLFFYAGHGLQVGGQNYLVPVDAQADTAAALDFQMVRLDLVQRTMEREAQTNILFLDACRDNPLARNLARTMGTRSTDVGRGLAAAESGVGTLISFSTQPGNVALDGDGRNSPYAGALVRQLSAAGDDLSAILIAVRNDVMTVTQRRQVPWEHSALTGRFYFAAAPQARQQTPAAPSAPAAPPEPSEAERAWNLAKDTTNIALLESFIARYKGTFHADLAKARIEELKARQATAAIPPAPRSQQPAAPPAAAPGAAPGVLATPQVAPSSIPANPANRFGAIAYSPSTGSHGWSYDYATREEAERVALANCGQHARDCNVPIWFQNACGALAVGPSGYGSGWAINQGLAEAYALGVCGQHSASCSVRRWVCTTR
jgi:uncharacterized caspase-like protein